VLWRRNVKEDHDLEYPTWGFSASPLVLDDMLFLNVGKVIALDKKTGEPRWTTEDDFGHAYSTPRDFEWKGKPCLAVFDGNGLVVLDRKDGRKLGFHEWKTKYDINAATPIVIGDGIFISSGMGRGAALLAVADDGIEVVWENREMNTKLSGCVLVEDHLYGFDEAVLKCMDLEGNELWAQRGLGDGCLSGAADRLLVMSADGELIVVAADPTGYRELSRTKVLEGGEYWTKPVLVNGLIYCRNSLGQLACLDHRGAN
jgi:outer membrane protein assembly factor BamB